MKRIVSFFVFLAIPIAVAAQGHWEIGVHYSGWSIDIVEKVIEENVIPDFDYYDSEKGRLNFDSNGRNYGLELRYFPGGENGSFSIGVSYERNYFKGTLQGSYTDKDSQGNRVDVSGNGTFEFVPHSFNVNLRWELWPRWRIHPYIGLGFGFGPQNGTLTLESKAISFYGALSKTETYSETRTLKQAIEEWEQEEGESFPLGFFPIVHAQLGVRGRLFGPLYFLLEGAFYDGLIIRGGVSVRI